MQIEKIILYGVKNQIRYLTFKLGKVNIISGKSKTGKSVIGDIIDYCLCGETCNIADGIVREKVKWYSLLLNLNGEKIFIARENPPIGQQSTNKFYYEIGNEINIPINGSFLANSNTDGIKHMLDSRLGIRENINRPPEGNTRLPIVANIRHALFYCFQNQDEIAAKNFLFHNQSKDFITQAIKDTMPYFLGIINEKFLKLENERHILKRKLNIEKRELEGIKLIQGVGMSKANELIAEAMAVGLISNKTNDNFNEAYHTLKNITEYKLVGTNSVGMDDLAVFQESLSEKRKYFDIICEKLQDAKKFIDDTYGYYNEVKEQKVRLESIGLFEKLNFNEGKCPLCSSNLDNELPSVEAIKRSIKNLDLKIKSVSKEKPKLQNYVNSLEIKKQLIKEEIKSIEKRIDGIYKQNKEAERIKDLNSRRAKVIGRISLWLESIEGIDDCNKKEELIKEYEEDINKIEKLLDIDTIEQKKQSILNRLSVEMTKLAKELELEYSNNPYRLDMRKVTVVVDKPERPVPLQQLGSGSNWLGVHLITYFALQKYFIKSKRPVPNFLFIDQPSQVYFPSDVDEADTDTVEVKKIYDFIFERVKELCGGLQIIIVDHAYVKNSHFEEAVVENWWHGDKLIPDSWI